MGDYRRMITLQRKIMTLQTFRELEEKLDPHYVMRIHKSYMIHLNALMDFKSSRVTLTNNMQLPVSETYRKALKERLQSGSFTISNKDAG
jgi:DNA-binding LytR/AlgR family response regulator